MRPSSVSAVLMVQAGQDRSSFEIARSETDELRHRVLNDYNAVIACIVGESASTENTEVKAALSRVADCVYDLAGSIRVDA